MKNGVFLSLNSPFNKALKNIPNFIAVCIDYQAMRTICGVGVHWRAVYSFSGFLNGSPVLAKVSLVVYVFVIKPMWLHPFPMSQLSANPIVAIHLRGATVRYVMQKAFTETRLTCTGFHMKKSVILAGEGGGGRDRNRGKKKLKGEEWALILLSQYLKIIDQIKTKPFFGFSHHGFQLSKEMENRAQTNEFGDWILIIHSITGAWITHLVIQYNSWWPQQSMRACQIWTFA